MVFKKPFPYICIQRERERKNVYIWIHIKYKYRACARCWRSISKCHTHTHTHRVCARGWRSISKCLSRSTRDGREHPFRTLYLSVLLLDSPLLCPRYFPCFRFLFLFFPHPVPFCGAIGQPIGVPTALFLIFNFFAPWEICVYIYIYIYTYIHR
jgi:hypothetical protein